VDGWVEEKGRKRLGGGPEGSGPSDGRTRTVFFWVPPRALALAMWVPRPGLFGPGPQRSWEVRVRNAEVTLWKRVKAPNSQMPTRHMNEFYAKPS